MHHEYTSRLAKNFKNKPKKWLITGVAGFIGSNLLETLLLLDQTVVGIDNFSTGHQRNLDEVKSVLSKEQQDSFAFIEGDITNYDTCREVTKDVNFVLHQAALGSVPRSISNPIATNNSNITGFLNILQAAKEEGVDSFTYAASSSTYGDHLSLPKKEEIIGNPLSPYAVTKFVNELYAGVYARVYGFKSVGLRYFNVFGKRQDPNGAYAAVIPKWISSYINNQEIFINGDGSTSRDFCFVENVVQANILAALAEDSAKNQVYNIALGNKTNLNELFDAIGQKLKSFDITYKKKPTYRAFRKGDVKHSQADISKARKYLKYDPLYKVSAGLDASMSWYLSFLR